ncbi:MAG TPA: arginine deiminase-related protein [Steroidobacteraceae bacterium]|nr:arginine deiminase-related protein [Steroidobacteraceae bacterium]
MIRPAAFDYNPDTAGSNRMQQPAGAVSGASPRELARREFDGVAGALMRAGVRVCVAEDTPEPPKPDAVFPNNWVSFHADGTLVLYPMQAKSRRRERRAELLQQVARELGFRARRTLDLTRHEDQDRFLEGTGSLVLDRANRVAYACRSPRTHDELIEAWCRILRYEPVVFTATDASGSAYYHTNVLLSIGRRAIVVCAEAIAADDRERVLARLEASGRELIEIDRVQLSRFCGNLLELAVASAAGAERTVLVMSSTAQRALGRHLQDRLAGSCDTLVSVEIPTIEHLGGGGVRCMLAEVFGAS